VAANDSYSVNEDTALTVAVSGVLSNDSDPDGNALTAVLVSGPAHAAAFSLNPDGSFSYTPSANYHGPDSFSYRANDGLTNSGVGTVSLTVTPLNDAPVAVNDTVSTSEDTPVTIAPLVNDFDVDGDALTLTSAGTVNGTVNIAGTNLVFTPSANFNGAASITYTISDGHDGTASATVAVTVTPANDAPVASSQDLSLSEDTAEAIALTGSDVDGNPLTFAIATGPANGVISGFNDQKSAVSGKPLANGDGA